MEIGRFMETAKVGKQGLMILKSKQIFWHLSESKSVLKPSDTLKRLDLRGRG